MTHQIVWQGAGKRIAIYYEPDGATLLSERLNSEGIWSAWGLPVSSDLIAAFEHLMGKIEALETQVGDLELQLEDARADAEGYRKSQVIMAKMRRAKRENVPMDEFCSALETLGKLGWTIGEVQMALETLGNVEES